MSVIKPFRFMDKHEIECRALDVLEAMKTSDRHVPTFPLDSSRVAEFLGLDVVWDVLPEDDEGAIAARILPLEKLIEINETILDLKEGFGESTIAHEVGHWVLHIDRQAVDRVLRLRQKGVNVIVKPLLCRNNEQIQGIEWQAQYFASCLLMPRLMLEEKIQGRDLTQWPDLYAIAADFGVTISNLLHRLKDLEWVSLKEGSKELVRC
ncbi:ImmA/IrrE family metallo-endopeptidase [Spirulina sp. 06S082]|uniref:ImmA/IrrE family metallo-endopeptidase n=1 Tax=Spirulina sp. 06S082 TaxID=3110248 RepID=UPI002B1F4B94|nr:ImmA/IrrE family metallo-endopeptidase [Spirulina sp. 06S082]MEA5468827.1 ImmA/IrrE family metallo-endopeptidase [Spirulina sp. 06S082]